MCKKGNNSGLPSQSMNTHTFRFRFFPLKSSSSAQAEFEQKFFHCTLDNSGKVPSDFNKFRGIFILPAICLTFEQRDQSLHSCVLVNESGSFAQVPGRAVCNTGINYLHKIPPLS